MFGVGASADSSPIVHKQSTNASTWWCSEVRHGLVLGDVPTVAVQTWTS